MAASSRFVFGNFGDHFADRCFYLRGAAVLDRRQAALVRFDFLEREIAAQLAADERGGGGHAGRGHRNGRPAHAGR